MFFFFLLTSIGSSNQGRTPALQGVEHGVIERSSAPRRGQLGQLRCNVRRVRAGVGAAEGPRQAVLVSAADVQRVGVAAVSWRPVIHGRTGRVVESTGSVWAPGAVWGALCGGLRPYRVAGDSVVGLRRAAGLQVRETGYHGTHPGAGDVHRGVGVGVHVTTRGRIISSLALCGGDGQCLVHVGGIYQQAGLVRSTREDQFTALV